jgi:hypothetical protein
MMSLSIDMTLHGVLLAGKWTTESGLKQHDDEWWRNHLITKLGHTSAKPDGYYQGFNNDELIGKGAILVFLLQAGTYDIAKLKTMSDVDQRKAIIEHDNQHTGIPVAVLQGLNNPQLVRLALVE